MENDELTPEQINEARGCECLAKLKGLLEKQTGTEVELQLRACVITDPEAENWQTFTDLPPLEYKFMQKRKVRKGHIKFSYCPFCGKKKS